METRRKYPEGQSDLMVIMPHGIYVMETKYDRSAAEALAQIDTGGGVKT